jgi:hypothetical protein
MSGKAGYGISCQIFDLTKTSTGIFLVKYQINLGTSFKNNIPVQA